MDTSGRRKNVAPVALRPQTRVIRKSQLSAKRRWLVDAMQGLSYGRIKDLIVVDREPVVKPPPKICPRRKLTGPRYRRRAVPRGDYILKGQVVNLFEELDNMVDGRITIEVRDGLPFDIFYE